MGIGTAAVAHPGKIENRFGGRLKLKSALHTAYFFARPAFVSTQRANSHSKSLKRLR